MIKYKIPLMNFSTILIDDSTRILSIKSIFINAQIISMESGHWVHAEQPEFFVESVQNFID